ncbi:hypothetical protein FNF26_002761 [Escherichia coli]|nr:hypothetical protein [Escherichia coli]
MTTITKERLQWLANISGRDDIDDIDGGEIRELASLEAEPVASCIIEDGGMCVDGGGEYVSHSLPGGTFQLYTASPVPVVPEGLVKAVRFYEQVKRENPPVETGAWKDAVEWVLKEACQAVNIRIKGE